MINPNPSTRDLAILLVLLLFPLESIRADDSPLGKAETLAYIQNLIATAANFNFNDSRKCRQTQDVKSTDSCTLSFAKHQVCRDSKGTATTDDSYNDVPLSILRPAAGYQMLSDVEWGIFSLSTSTGKDQIPHSWSSDDKYKLYDGSPAEDHDQGNKNSSSLNFNVANADAGKRLGNAFNHLISLCGGKMPPPPPKDPFAKNDFNDAIKGSGLTSPSSFSKAKVYEGPDKKASLDNSPRVFSNGAPDAATAR